MIINLPGVFLLLQTRLGNYRSVMHAKFIQAYLQVQISNYYYLRECCIWQVQAYTASAKICPENYVNILITFM